ELRLLNWRSEPLRLSARIANEGSANAAIAIRQTYFAGWRGWLDGKPVPLQIAPYVPEQQTSPGFLVVTVPPGEHTLAVAFGPTRPRLIGMAVTLVSILLVAGAAAWYLHQVASGRWLVARHRPLATSHLFTLVVGWLAVALVAGYATWRGVRP